MSDETYTPKIVPWHHRTWSFLRTPDERTVLEGLSSGGGTIATVELHAMVQDVEYVRRFHEAYGRLAERRST